MSSISDAQSRILKKFLSYAKDTAYGKKYGFENIQSYDEYREQVPISTFSDYDEYRESLKKGVPDLVWPGSTKIFATSAGTTGDPKLIPIFEDRKRSDKIFLRRVALSYLRNNPNIFRLAGKQISLPGMIDDDPDHPGVQTGEISGFLSMFAPPILAKLQLVPSEEAVRMDFETKVRLNIKRSMESDVRVITSLPSVCLRMMQTVLEETGKDSIKDVWPNLKVVTSGGEPLPSYKEHIESLCKGLDLHYIENYGASEGYFAFNTEQGREDLKLVVNNNVFYEWIPNPSENREELKKQDVIPTWEVEEGVPYGMVITSNSGLWRYLLNDVVYFTDMKKPRIRVAGRASDVLDAYGETMEAIHIKEVLEKTVAETGGVYSNYTVGAFLASDKESPTHAWFIEWAEKPADPEKFAKLIDENMIELNRSYKIRRMGNAIAHPRFYNLTRESVSKWRDEFFTKVGAQTKLPRTIRDQKKCMGLINYCERLA